MGEHAKLSPSAAARWTNCPASVRLTEDLPDESSVYAEHGTAAHAYAEIIAKRELLGDHRAADLLMWDRKFRKLFTREEFEDMQRHVAAYVDHLRGMLADAGPFAVLLLEVKVQTGIPGCWGTSDAVIVAPGVVEVIDLKFGAGVPVYAERNAQAMLYGVGALEELGDLLDDVETVGVSIFQPRVGDGHASRWELPADELRAWRDGLQDVAAEALAGSDRFGPSAKACRWCPLAGPCKAQADDALQTMFGDEADEPKRPDLLTPEELADVLEKVPAVKQWLSRVEAFALDELATRGGTIPGWKAVLSGGRRSIADEREAGSRLVAAGFDLDELQVTKLVALGTLEKVVGKKELADLLDGVLVKSDGKPTVVPESDKRDPVMPVIAMFDDED